MYPKIDRAALDAILAQKRPKLREVDLTAIDVRTPPIDFSGVHIDSCTLSNLNFDGMKFRKATIKHCWVNGTSFVGADFTEATFVGAFAAQKMSGAIFKDAKLKKVELMSSDVRNADFTGANLEGANFMATDVAGAKFTGANIARAEFDLAENVASAIGLADADSGDSSTIFATIAPEGGPVVAIPTALVKTWPGEAMGEGTTTVCDWVETSSADVGGARVLLLDGEMDTGVVAIEGGVMLIRGGDFEAEIVQAQKAAAKALKKKKGWVHHAHEFVSDGSGLSLIDANGAADPVTAPLAKGRYAVDVLGTQGPEGPVVFIRLSTRP